MSPVGLQLLQVGDNDARNYSDGARVDVDLHTRTQITLLPTSSERLSISPALLFTKDQNTGGIIVGATERK